MRFIPYGPIAGPETSGEKLRLKRALSITLLGLAGMDSLGSKEFEQKVMEIHTDLNDSLAHLERFVPPIEKVCALSSIKVIPKENHSKLEQGSSIVFLCIEIVTFAMAGIEARLAKNVDQVGSSMQRLRSLSIRLTKKLQALVVKWLKVMEHQIVSKDQCTDRDDYKKGPFDYVIRQLEPYFDASIFSQLRQAVEPHRRTPAH